PTTNTSLAPNPQMPLDLDLTPDVLKYLAQLPAPARTKLLEEIGRQEWDKCASDPMYWIDQSRHALPYVYTRDPKQLYTCKGCSDGNTYTFDSRIRHLQIRHEWEPDRLDVLTSYDFDEHFDGLPTTRPFTLFPYIEPIVKTWLREKILFIEKSRDMMITWLTVTLYTWDTLFHKNRENIFQSDDSSKALDLVERAHFIWDNQPAFLKNVHPVSFSHGQTRGGILKVPDLKSVIYGFPAGPDQIRQFHPSGCFQDEAAFQAEAEAAFTAIKPAIQAGGRFTAVSSANAGWFHRCVKDVIA
ncbi:MAG TPA: hypothetical protein VNV63_02065, partial [Nitrospiria bacterium]|nr:hypothetical protein [Nitrospiria bacterium]